jgi:putative transposase
MLYQPSTMYHIYNQGNNQEKVFFNHANYLFFLQKIRSHLLQHSDVLCYRLMPNHFHLLVFTKPALVPEAYALSKGLNVLLRSYTRAINVQEKRSGSLFRPNTKAKDGIVEGFITVDGKHKDLFFGQNDYAWTCFHYIHDNPVKAGLVDKAEDWPYSSASDYAGIRNGSLCNQGLAKKVVFGFPE